MIKHAGRFITRGAGDDGNGAVDLIIGAGFKSGTLKPNKVYTITDMDGTLVITETGESIASKKTWAKDASRILTEDFPQVLLTREEYAELSAKGRL